ncbi:hypothetical protein LTR37_017777 [Vermiconidia calcicola]|uniref:Uncharacterized protein n=1 Tax=Vermiconidia calcicola TaxID=1690605 RepID=A0ACC3MIS0_9PEZI|nr:hypothetical protein LTR37_017777 [Vermiconidia calcicola]
MANGGAQTNGVRPQAQQDPPAILHLLPMNGTFERKTITVPYYPDVLRIGRQTNQKTIPTPLNGYFDSKVLSRQHAEVYADRQGRIFIRDVKSSNGTFVNGMRLSQENKESEPREMREQDVLELGIDIVSEDQKTVVHHKVAAKVEHAGVYGQGSDPLNFGDLDPSSGSPLLAGPSPLRRSGSQGSLPGRGSLNQAMGQTNGVNAVSQQQHMRNWLNPISMEHIVKKLNAELKFAEQQSKDLERARVAIEVMLGGKVESPTKDSKPNSDKSRPSPSKSKTDLKAHFSEPPAPPPSAPLPEKPDVARALADPLIQPLLRRSDTAKPPSEMNSPTKSDHSSDILRLCEELKLAKGELSNQGDRMRSLESELAQERTARESAEERAQILEQGERRDSPRDSFTSESVQTESASKDGSHEAPPDLQVQLDRLRASMDEMKQQMEAYRRRAEIAESERDEVRHTLAEMVEQKRKENSERTSSRPSSRGGKSHRSPTGKHTAPQQLDGQGQVSTNEPNGHAISPTPSSPTSETLLERAGVEEGQPITPEQAKILTQFLTQEVLNSHPGGAGDAQLMYHGRPAMSAAAVVLLGVVLMGWMNGWVKVER